jgi:hypothetical protein
LVSALKNLAMLSQSDIASSFGATICQVITGERLATAAFHSDCHAAAFVLGASAFYSDLCRVGVQVYGPSDHKLAARLFKLRSDINPVAVAEDPEYAFATASLAARYVKERRAAASPAALSWPRQLCPRAADRIWPLRPDLDRR